MLTFDFFLWSFIGLYFDQVAPRDFGIAKQWNFPIKLH
jgi:hypothetical protein